MKVKFNKFNLVCIGQIVAVIICLIIGFYFKAEASVVSSSILGMLTKMQSTSSFQNFVWFFTHNFTIMFMFYWLSYWSFGVIGTAWCLNNAFMLGILFKAYLSFVSNPWLSFIFMFLELVSSVVIMLLSTRFKLERFLTKRKFGKDGELYLKSKKRQQKKIMVMFAAIICILLISATLEVMVVNSL